MQSDPIVYPKVQIGPDLVEVKYRVGDLVRLEKAGIDISDLKEVRGIQAMERTLTFLQHGIAHKMSKTVDELADLVDLAYLPQVSAAIGEAFSKANAQATKPAATPSQVN